MRMGGHVYGCGHASLPWCTVMVSKHRLTNKSMHVHRQEELVGRFCNEWDTNEKMFPLLLIPQIHGGMTSTAQTANWQNLTREKTHIYTWRLRCHHGRWGRHVVRVGGRCEGWVHPSAWRLCLGMGHEGVIHAYWGWRIVILIDWASACVLITIHKHVQESLWKIMEEWQLHPCTPLQVLNWIKG